MYFSKLQIASAIFFSQSTHRDFLKMFQHKYLNPNSWCSKSHSRFVRKLIKTIFNTRFSIKLLSDTHQFKERKHSLPRPSVFFFAKKNKSLVCSNFFVFQSYELRFSGCYSVIIICSFP